MIQLFDSHCHIQASSDPDSADTDNTAKLWAKSGLSQQELIDRAKKDGVNYLMLVGCDLGDSHRAATLAAKQTGLYASAGIHPHEADRHAAQENLLNEFADLATSQGFKAIGECGLDYFYTHSSKSNQQALLKFQIELAIKLNLPLIFHVREAYEDFWPIFDSYNKGACLRGVLHSYTDNQANLDMALKRGLFIGVNGIATFTKDLNQLEVYKQIPLSNLILETDAPYLTPTPLRGNINEPRNVVLVAEFLASFRGESLEVLAKATTENSRQLFRV